jgi:HSP20 family protein
VDIYETTDAIVMKAELPGVSREDIQIQLHENTLTLKGERRFAKDVQEESYLRIERAYGSFHRSFTLPSVVHQETIRAVFRDGVLELTLPKAEGAKPKRISIDLR